MSYGTYRRLNAHVGESDLVILRRLRRKITKKARNSRAHRTARHELYRAVLLCHHHAQGIVREWRL